jgi:hypothetical protein
MQLDCGKDVISYASLTVCDSSPTSIRGDVLSERRPGYRERERPVCEAVVRKL